MVKRTTTGYRMPLCTSQNRKTQGYNLSSQHPPTELLETNHLQVALCHVSAGPQYPSLTALVVGREGQLHMAFKEGLYLTKKAKPKLISKGAHLVNRDDLADLVEPVGLRPQHLHLIRCSQAEYYFLLALGTVPSAGGSSA